MTAFYRFTQIFSDAWSLETTSLPIVQLPGIWDGGEKINKTINE